MTAQAMRIGSHVRSLTRGPRLGADGRIWLLTASIATLTAILFVTVLDRYEAPASGVRVPVFVLAALFAVTEVFVVHLSVRRETHSISLSEVTIVLALFATSPATLLGAQLAGAVIALTLHRRQVPIKLCFNLAQFALVSSVAVLVFRAVGGADPASARAWAGALAAVLVADLVAGLLMAAVLAAAEGALDGSTLRELIGFGSVCSAVNGALGLLVVVLVAHDARLAWLLAAPVALTFVAYRTIARERSRRRAVGALAAAARRLSTATSPEGAIVRVLEEARQLFRAETTGLVVAQADAGTPPVRAVLGPDGRVEVTIIDGVPSEHERVSQDAPLILAASASGEAIAVPAFSRTVRDAMLVTVGGPRLGIDGLLLVADRENERETFGGDDAPVLTAFAGSAAAALAMTELARSLAEVTRVRDELAHRALHDELTGLANRALFLDRVEHALMRRDHSVSALFIDIDDFKHINDVLGHAAGDRALATIGERLRASVRPGDTASRIGGDEFAVLIDGADVDASGSAEAVAERILAAISSLPVDGRQVELSTSIGIAHAGVDRSTKRLLDEADAAMYAAKRAGKGRFRVYRPGIRRSGTFEVAGRGPFSRR